MKNMEKSVRNLALVYEEFKFGVYIQGVSGKLYTSETWINQETANGVAVLTENHSFVLAKHSISYGFYATDMNPPLSQLDYNQAIEDFDGESNTEILMNYLNENSYVSDLIQETSEYVFPNGKTGYMGAAGEWDIIKSNKTEIGTLLELIGFSASFYGFDTSYKWTSSRCLDNSNGMWLWRYGFGSGLTNNNTIGTSVTYSMPLQKIS